MNKHVKHFIESNIDVLESSVEDFVTLFDVEQICGENYDGDAAEEFLNLMYKHFKEFKQAYDTWENTLNDGIDKIYNKYPYTSKINQFMRATLDLPVYNFSQYHHTRILPTYRTVSDVPILTPSKEKLSLRSDYNIVGHSSRTSRSDYYFVISSSEGKHRSTKVLPRFAPVTFPNFGEFFTHEKLKECLIQLEQCVKFMSEEIERCVLSFDWERRAKDIVPHVQDLMIESCSKYLTNCHVEAYYYDDCIDLCLTSDELPEETTSATVSIEFTKQDPDKMDWNKEMLKLKNRIKRMQQK